MFPLLCLQLFWQSFGLNSICRCSENAYDVNIKRSNSLSFQELKYYVVICEEIRFCFLDFAFAFAFAFKSDKIWFLHFVKFVCGFILVFAIFILIFSVCTEKSFFICFWCKVTSRVLIPFEIMKFLKAKY